MFIFPGPTDLAIASTWSSRSQFARNKPDATDVGPQQFENPTNIHSLSRSQKAKQITKKESDKIIAEAEDFREVTKIPKKQHRTCDDLIHLHGPCTEVSIISNLKARFTENILQVKNLLVSIPCSVCIKFIFQDLDWTCPYQDMST